MRKFNVKKYLKSYITAYSENTDSTEYAIILTYNKKIVTIVQNYKTKNGAENLFNRIKTENKTVIPAKYTVTAVNGNRLSEHIYEILLVKKKDEDSIERRIITGIGIFTEKVIGDWEILDRFEFNVEQDYKVYGYKSYMHFQEIIANLFMSRINNSKEYDVLVYKSKIVITDFKKDFDVIICRCPEEALELNHTLLNYFFSKCITKFFFKGTVIALKDRKKLIAYLLDNTDMSLSTIRRKFQK